MEKHALKISLMEYVHFHAVRVCYTKRKAIIPYGEKNYINRSLPPKARSQPTASFIAHNLYVLKMYFSIVLTFPKNLFLQSKSPSASPLY